MIEFRYTYETPEALKYRVGDGKREIVYTTNAEALDEVLDDFASFLRAMGYHIPLEGIDVVPEEDDYSDTPRADPWNGYERDGNPTQNADKLDSLYRVGRVEFRQSTINGAYELVEWIEPTRCYAIAFFDRTEEGYDMRTVGDRFFTSGPDAFKCGKHAMQMLNNFFDEENDDDE